jgi:hypothetical protein
MLGFLLRLNRGLKRGVERGMKQGIYLFTLFQIGELLKAIILPSEEMESEA